MTARDAPTSLKLFELNASYLMVKLGRVAEDPALLAHIFSSLNHVRSGDSKCIEIAIMLLKELIGKILNATPINQELVGRLASRLGDLSR